MTTNPLVRNLLGIVLGGCAGFSLAVSVLPMALSMARFGDQLALAGVLAPMWPWSALLVAAGGWNVARLGAPLFGMLILGVAGLAAALLTVGGGLGLVAGPMAVGGLAGAVYGALGGLILGRVLARPATEETA
jgi:hypothetical protein